MLAVTLIGLTLLGLAMFNLALFFDDHAFCGRWVFSSRSFLMNSYKS